MGVPFLLGELLPEHGVSEDVMGLEYIDGRFLFLLPGKDTGLYFNMVGNEALSIRIVTFKIVHFNIISQKHPL